MIAILSTPKELTTDEVMDWLGFYNCDVIRINDNALVDDTAANDLEVSNDGLNFELSNDHFCLDRSRPRTKESHLLRCESCSL